MDDRRFDNLVKSIATTASRRTVLRGVLGVAASAAGVTALRGSDTDAARRGFSGPTFPTPRPTATPTPSCGAGQTPCGSGCVDTATDPANCGGCGIACGAGGICQAGSCVACSPDYSGCSQGAECCSGFCMQYGASGNNCEPCEYTLCSGFECSNTDRDDNHCGGCGNACAPGLHCWDAVCQQCYPPYIGGCTSNAQCCDPDAYCRQAGSVTVCETCAGTICGDFLCVDTTTDVQHCGGCGVACPSGYCYQGQCTTCTPPGYGCSGNSECCTGYCQTYGASGNACGECNGTVCGESLCVDLNSDLYHCGACGNACTGGATCQFGICIGGIET